MTSEHESCRGTCSHCCCESERRVNHLSELLASGRTTCNVDEAALVLGIGRSTAYAAARDGSLPTIRLSRRLLVPTAKLLAMLGCQGEVLA